MLKSGKSYHTQSVIQVREKHVDTAADGSPTSSLSEGEKGHFILMMDAHLSPHTAHKTTTSTFVLPHWI